MFIPKFRQTWHYLICEFFIRIDYISATKKIWKLFVRYWIDLKNNLKRPISSKEQFISLRQYFIIRPKCKSCYTYSCRTHWNRLIYLFIFTPRQNIINSSKMQKLLYLFLPHPPKSFYLCKELQPFVIKLKTFR